MEPDSQDIFFPYRLVAEYADGARLLFDGITEAQAEKAVEAAQALHGCLVWYDGVTDQHYENGHFYKLSTDVPTICGIDLTEYDGPLDENGLPPFLTGNPPVDE